MWKHEPTPCRRPFVNFKLFVSWAVWLLAVIGSFLPYRSVTGKTNPRVTVHADGRSSPWINLRDGFTAPSSYVGMPAKVLENNAAQALSLTAADFDEDGIPDLIAGYVSSADGFIAIYRGNVDLLFPKNGQTDEFAAPFLSPAKTFIVPEAPDFLGAGDFDADGHWDVVTAAHGSDALYLLPGDGRGSFSPAKLIKLPGTVTALVTGEINRRDGLTDVVVGIVGPDGPQALVFESPNGALRDVAQPSVWENPRTQTQICATCEAFPLPAEATAMALGQLDDSYEMDLAVAAGSELVIVHGRDRKLSLDQTQQAAVQPASIEQTSVPYTIASMALGDFVWDEEHRTDIALLAQDGMVRLLSRQKAGKVEEWQSEILITSDQRLATSDQLVRAKVSSLPSDDLVILDPVNHQLHILTLDNEQRAKDQGRRTAVTLDTGTTPMAALPMRLNKDALSDLVILRSGESAPSVVLTAPTAVFAVNSTGNEPDFAGCDGVCAIDCVRDAMGNCIRDANGCPIPAGPCTYHAAREQANFCPPGGPNPCGRNDEIDFNIPGAGPFVIDWFPVGNSMTLTIDGYTQPGANPNTLPNGDNAVLKIQIRGPKGGLGTAVNFNGSNSVVRGLAFTDFCGGKAIGLGGTGNHIAEGNFTGTDTNATAHVGCNGSGGIFVGGNNNRIGGTTPQARNLLTDTGIGIDSTGSNTVIQGNFIGTDRTGTQALGAGHGVFLSVLPGNPGINNTIGGTVAGARNIISGHADGGPCCGGSGIRVESAGNLVQGNYIGLDVTGSKALGNRFDGSTSVADNLTIGGTTPAARNVISANGGFGLNLIASNNLVQGNFIGTDGTGTITDPDGVPNSGDELGNRGYGVSSGEGPGCNPATTITIGGTAAGARNVISGNGLGGQFIHGVNVAFSGIVQGNFIGTDVTGTLARGNVGSGVRVVGANSLIGGTDAGARNVISANGGNGVDLAGDFNTQTIRLQGNYIGLQANGVSALGNVEHGVFAFAPIGGTIGGTAAGEGNRIAFNGGNGVLVFGVERRMAILGNSIFSNNLLGIQLENSANNSQAAPVLTSATSSGGIVNVAGTLKGPANTTFRLEFFANNACDPSGSGEGQIFIGTAQTMTDNNGNASFTVKLAAVVSREQVITATATEDSNTSKFSKCIQVQ